MRDFSLDEGVSADLDNYRKLNPAYTDQLAEGELMAIFFRDPEGTEPRTPREVNARLEVFRTIVQAKIEQLTGNPTWEEKGPATSEEFRRAPRTFLKTVEEILVEPQDRMTFKRSDNPDPQHLPLSPRLITDTILKNLGLDEYLPVKGSTRAQKMERRKLAIPKIKEMLKNLEPMKSPGYRDPEDLRYFRLMRMNKGKNEGFILGTQNIEGQKVLFKTDIYGAERRLLHIEEGYKEEIATLKEIQSVLENARTYLQNWLNLSEEDLEEIKFSLAKCIERLQFVRNGDKKRLKLQVEKSLTLRDSRGRQNPSATQARLTAALGNLGSRLDEISEIWSYIGRDKAKTSQLISDQNEPMNKFSATVETLHKKFRILRPDEPLTAEEKAKIKNNLLQLQQEASAQKFEPHMTIGKKVNVEIAEILTALETDDLRLSAREFVKIYFIAKLQRAYDEIQSVYKDISLNPELSNPQDVYDRTQKIHDKLRSHDVAPDMEVDDYYNAYKEFYHLLNGMKKEFRAAIPEQQSELPFPEAPKPSMLENIISKFEKLPGIRKVLGQVRNLFAKALGGEGKQAKASEPKTVVDKKEAYVKAKKRIQNFDFVKLAQENL